MFHVKHLEAYLAKHRKELIERKIHYTKTLEMLNTENTHLNAKIEELVKNIDNTFNVFSPIGNSGGFNEIEVKKLEQQLRQNEEKIVKIKDFLANVENELLEINLAIDEFYKKSIKNEAINKNSVNIDLHNKKINQYGNLVNYITRKQYERFIYFADTGFGQIVDSILYRKQLCDEFINYDINRTKSEMIAIEEGINTLQYKINEYLFHVKQIQITDREISLGKTIKQLFDKYKDYYRTRFVNKKVIEDIVILDENSNTIDNNSINNNSIDDSLVDKESNYSISDQCIESTNQSCYKSMDDVSKRDVEEIEKTESNDNHICFKLTGQEIKLLNVDIMNIINIIDELVHNSVFHGKASFITIELLIEDVNNEQNHTINQLDMNGNKNEKKQDEMEDYAIQLTKDVRHIRIIVSDNGYGFVEEQLNKTGMFGLDICRNRLNIYDNSKLTIHSDKDTGTVVNIEFDYEIL